MPNFGNTLEAGTAKISTLNANTLNATTLASSFVRGALEPTFQSVAAAGTDLGGAGVIEAKSTVVVVTSAVAAAGVALPALADVELGKIYLIYVDGGTGTCELYPQADDAIQSGADGAAHTISVDTLQICFKASADKWVLLEAVGTAGDV